MKRNCSVVCFCQCNKGNEAPGLDTVKVLCGRQSVFEIGREITRLPDAIKDYGLVSHETRSFTLYIDW